MSHLEQIEAILNSDESDQDKFLELLSYAEQSVIPDFQKKGPEAVYRMAQQSESADFLKAVGASLITVYYLGFLAGSEQVPRSKWQDLSSLLIDAVRSQLQSESAANLNAPLHAKVLEANRAVGARRAELIPEGYWSQAEVESWSTH